MDPRSAAIGARSYEDFVPASEWITGEGSDTLIIELPGFSKEQLRVQLDNYGNLRTSGERPIDGQRWRRFRKEFHVPDSCNAGEIRAKFESGVLTVTLPKLITEAEPLPVAPAPLQAPEPQAMPKPSEPVAKEPVQGETADVEGVSEKAEDKEKGEGSTIVKEEGSKFGVGGIVLGTMNKRRQLGINVAVAAVVLVGVGIYVAYKFKSIAEAEIREHLCYEEF